MPRVRLGELEVSVPEMLATSWLVGVDGLMLDALAESLYGVGRRPERTVYWWLKNPLVPYGERVA